MIRNNALPNERFVTLTRANRQRGVPAKIRLRSATSVPRGDSAPGLADRIKDAQTMRVVFPKDIPLGQFTSH